MGEARYIAELAQRTGFPPDLAIAASFLADQEGNILSFFDTAQPTSSYWLDWGGSYDNPTTTQLQILFASFLQQVGTTAALLSTSMSFYISGTFVIINTEIYPWMYRQSETELLTIVGLSSAPTNPLNPSDDTIDVSGVKIHYPTRLIIPGSSFANKISDPISGNTLRPVASFQIKNEDGKYDRANATNFFNTPVRIKKSSKANPTMADYKTIYYGLVDDVSSDWQFLNIKSANVFKSLDDEVCRVFTVEEYPDAEDSVLGDSIPKIWGPAQGVKLIQVDDNAYIASDPQGYISAVTTVYDNDGNSITFSFDSDSGIIASTESDGEGGYVEPETADVTGASNNRIGEIVTSEMAISANIAYVDGVWDITETAAYVVSSARLGMVFNGGKVKKLIEMCLENDNAFLIQKNDGQLTLRQWGESYEVHTIPSWETTKQTKRTHVPQELFTSSAIVGYGYHEDTENYDGLVLDDSRELDIFEEWRKKQRLQFPRSSGSISRLVEKSAAESLASRMIDRFGGRPEIQSVATGHDLSEVNPLDTVTLTLVINGRTLSDVTDWIVREVNPAQDTLVLEEWAT